MLVDSLTGRYSMWGTPERIPAAETDGNGTQQSHGSHRSDPSTGWDAGGLYRVRRMFSSAFDRCWRVIVWVMCPQI